MRKSTSALLVVSLATAILLEPLLALRWWHPYCDSQADGPGFWATGFPFPYAEPTGATSLDYSLLIPVYLLNLTIIALPIFLTFRAVRGSIPRVVQAVVAALAMAGAALGLFWTSLFAVPTLATQHSRYDRLSVYRPAFTIDFRRHRACDPRTPPILWTSIATPHPRA